MINIDDKLNIHFPMKMKPRGQQIDILQKCKNTINNGKKYILIDAPTGSGKSFFAIMFSNWYRNYVDENAKIDIITNSKILQEQYHNSFDYIKVLKGQANYSCNQHIKSNCQEGKEINALMKTKCSNCPYDIAKNSWNVSDIGITNFHMFNSLSIFRPASIATRNSNVLIIDEATHFESVFCSYLSIKLNTKILKKYGMDMSMIEHYDKKFIKIKTITQVMNFIKDDFLPYIIELNNEYAILIKSDESDEYKKYFIYTSSNIEKFRKILEKYDKDPLNWALDRPYTKEKTIELVIEPIWGYDYLNEYIWGNYDHIIFMSGTILDKGMFSYINGLPIELTDYYSIDSDFPLKNRPIYYAKNIGKMTYDLKELTFKNQISIINKILKKYEKDKGIIHTTNYELADWIKNSIYNNRLVFHDLDNREDIYFKFIKNNGNDIIVSPSMTTGISLDNELARFQVILKVPYPNISSNKIKARQRSNSNWYNYVTCIEIMQAYGRIVRSNEDFGDTFILDSCFSDLLRNTSFFPRWFTDAIKILK